MASSVEELRNCIIAVGKLYDEEQIKDIMSHVKLTFVENFRVFEFLLNEPQQEEIVEREVNSMVKSI